MVSGLGEVVDINEIPSDINGSLNEPGDDH